MSSPLGCIYPYVAPSVTPRFYEPAECTPSKPRCPRCGSRAAHFSTCAILLQNQRELNEADHNSLSRDADTLEILNRTVVSEAVNAECILELAAAAARNYRCRN